MKTSGIAVPISEAEAPLLRIAMPDGAPPHPEPENILNRGIFNGGDIYFCRDNGWIYFELPSDTMPFQPKNFVFAQVWTGSSHIHTVETPIDYSLQMSFPAGILDEQKILIGIYRREIVAHHTHFRQDHDTSIDGYGLFTKGIEWVINATGEYRNRI